MYKKLIPMMFMALLVMGVMAFGAPTQASAQYSSCEETEYFAEHGECSIAWDHADADLNASLMVSEDCWTFVEHLEDSLNYRYYADYVYWTLFVDPNAARQAFNLYENQVTQWVTAACGIDYGYLYSSYTYNYLESRPVSGPLQQKPPARKERAPVLSHSR